MTELPAIDWALAARLGAALAPRERALSRAERADAVRSLRRVADAAHAHAVAVSGLPDPGQRIGVEVLGRGGWIAANARSAAAMVAPLSPAAPRGLGGTVAARAIAAQVAPVLGWISAKIVGQFDPYAPEPVLYFVAPNVLHLERELGVDPEDFRLWVAVHEQTHRLQFHRAPWLRAHLQERLVQVVELGGGAGGRLTGSLLDAVTSPEQRQVIDDVTAIMSVIEGYAEVMMDRVGPETIPTVDAIRAKFERRRDKRGLDAVARKLLGLDLKMAQYRDGAAFCRAVIERVGVPGLNRVFEAPELLPSHEELLAPERWLARVG